MAKRNKIVKMILSAFFILLCAALFAGVVICHEKKQANVYTKTYYAALVPMYEKLEKTEGKKIVVIGNSAIPFGLDTALLNELMEAGGYSYKVCNFGLYGSIGTRTMLELAKTTIKEGDIVIFMPEAEAQSQSMYFSATELWYCLEQNKTLITGLGKELRGSMYANYPQYVSKRSRITEEILPRDIYALSSFDDNMDLKNYDRSSNIMQDMADENSPVRLDNVVLSEEYLDYVNSFYADILKKGADMYFMYGPMNEAAIEGNIEDYCRRVKEGYAFNVIGDFADSLMDCEWFYDSNFHLNRSGMTVFSVQFFNNLKTLWKDSSVTELTLPEKPSEQKQVAVIEGDSSDEDCFEYEEKGEGYRIVGLTEKGKGRYSLTVPVYHEGKMINSISNESLKEAEKLREITIQQNIRSIPDYVFQSCNNLEKIILKHENPQEITVGYHLLYESKAIVYVPEASKYAFKNNYFWGSYAEVIKGYE